MNDETRARSAERRIHAVAIGAIALATACVTELPARTDTAFEDGGDDHEASCPGHDHMVASEPPTAYAIVAGDVPVRADGLPLFESNPGANVAMFVDFDGGTYRRSSGALEDYGPASLDGDRSTFNGDEQAKILRAVTDLAANYAAYDVNVTTDPDAMRRSPKWTWLLVTNDYGSRSGRAQIDDIGRKGYANGLAGTLAVLEPLSYEQPAYLLTHEFGHTFGLEHAGRFSDGDFEEYSDYASGPRGAFMGGRGSQFDTYRWRELRISDGSRQDPDAIIAGEAGYRDADGGGTTGTTELGAACSADGECRSGNCHEEGATDRCRPASCSASDSPGDGEFCELDLCGPCRADEGDCDSDEQCLPGSVCEQRDGTDYCRIPGGGSTALGEACSADLECASGNCHEEGPTDRCRPSTCTSADSPGDGEFCETTICGPCRVDEGDCDSDAQCLGDAVCEQQDGSDFCRVATSGDAPLGEVCGADADCASGNCHEEGATDRCRPSTCTSADSPDDGEFCETHICGPCRVSEGDCDSDAQCIGDATCDQREGNDYCIASGGCADDSSFVDAQGYGCDGWDGYDCDDATSRYGYSQAEEDAIVAACPRTCGTCS